MKQKRKSLRKDKRGFTGLEAAIVLTAFVVVAAVFSYVVLSAGFFTTDTAKKTIHTGVQQASSAIEVSGDVIGMGNAANTQLDTMKATLQLCAGGEPIDMADVILTYSDDNDYVGAVTFGETADANKFTATRVSLDGDNDNVLEGIEKFELVLDLNNLNVDTVSLKTDTGLDTANAAKVEYAANDAMTGVDDTNNNDILLKGLSVFTPAGDVVLTDAILGSVNADAYPANTAGTITFTQLAGTLNGTAISPSDSSMTIVWDGNATQQEASITSMSGTIKDTSTGANAKMISITGGVGTVNINEDTPSSTAVIKITAVDYTYVVGTGVSKPTANTKFTLQIKPAVGAVLPVERTVPTSVADVMVMH